jgi:hypothetical protein
MAHIRMPSPKRASLLAVCESQLRCVLDLQALVLEELQVANGPVPSHLAELLEDVANRLLDVSEIITDRHLAARRAAPSSPSGTESVCPGEG